MSRIMWLSNAPWVPSGYGEQSKLFVPRLRDLGHEMAFVCNYGLEGQKQDWGGIPVYPTDQVWANSALGSYADDFQPDLIFALCDAFVLHPDEWPDDLNVAVWAPVDHYPVPPAVGKTLMHNKVRPVAMSRFGEEQMRMVGMEPLYVPHAVDTSVFKPNREIKGLVRDELEVPRDAFLVGMVAANQSPQDRKGFAQAFSAFAGLSRRHDDAWMYCHTNPDGALDLVAHAGLEGVTQMRFPPKRAWDLGMSQDLMANLYQAFDVLLAPSKGEGFGIPIMEAQACGVPVVVSNHSALPEVGKVGWVVDGQPEYDHHQKAFYFTAFIDAIDVALEEAYGLRGNLEISEAAAMFARDTYDIETVMENHMAPVIEKLLRKPEAPLVLNRQQRRKMRKKVLA